MSHTDDTTNVNMADKSSVENFPEAYWQELVTSKYPLNYRPDTVSWKQFYIYLSEQMGKCLFCCQKRRWYPGWASKWKVFTYVYLPNYLVLRSRNGVLGKVYSLLDRQLADFDASNITLADDDSIYANKGMRHSFYPEAVKKLIHLETGRREWRHKQYNAEERQYHTTNVPLAVKFLNLKSESLHMYADHETSLKLFPDAVAMISKLRS